MPPTRAAIEEATGHAPVRPAGTRSAGFGSGLRIAVLAALVAFLALTPLAPFASEPAASESRRHLVLTVVFGCYGAYLLWQRRLPRGSALDVAALAVCAALALAVWGAVDRRAGLEWLLVALPAAPLALILRDRHLLSASHLRWSVLVGAVVVSIPAYGSVWRQWQDWLALVRAVEGGLSAAVLLPPAVPRVSDVGSHPNVLGAVLALTLPFAVVSLSGARRAERAAAAGALVMVAGALFFTLSRTAWVAGAAGCLVSGTAVFAGKLPARRLWLGVAGGALLAALALTVMLGGARPAWLYRDSLDPRADMRRAGIDIAKEHPLTGAGPGMFPLLYAAHQGRYPFAAVHAHNSAIQLAVDSGVTGLAAAAALLGTALARVVPPLLGRRRERRIAAAIPAGVLAALLVDGLGDAPHLYPEGLLLVAVAMALAPPFAANDLPAPLRAAAGGPFKLSRGGGRRPVGRAIAGLSNAPRFLVRGSVPVLLALAALLTLLWWWSDHGASLHEKAVAATAAGDRDGGIRLAERAIAWDHRQSVYHLQLGAALSSRYGKTRDPADRDRAISAYRRALALQPYHAGALVDLTALLLDQQDVEGAREAVARLGRLAGGDRLLQAAYAALVEQLAPVDDAITVYAGLLAIDPALAATPLFQSGFRAQHADAIVERALQRAGELAAPGPALDGRRAAILVFAGRDAPSEAVVRRRLEDDPDDPAALVALGRVLLAQGRVAEAEAPLRQAVARTGDDADARRALGDWYAAGGDPGAARHQWMIAAWLGSAGALNALGESYPAGSVPNALIERQRQALTTLDAMRFVLLAQNVRFALLRREPSPIIGRGDWLLAQSDDFYRWSANLERWVVERATGNQ